MQTLNEAPASAGTNRKVLKGSVVTILGFGGAQVLRLGGNLVLTRILMPEAFGLMALITILLVGLKLFSDVGIGQSILRSPRGDDPEFLDTAWTLDLIRGFVLWGIACLLAWPLMRFYQIEDLGLLIIVASSSLAIAGFEPTRVDLALRHLRLERVTLFDLLSQFLALVVMIVIAWLTKSVWALVVGQVAGAVIRLIIMTKGLPGQRNRFRLERPAISELIHFGKWVFVSTIAGFVVLQGDKIILSTFLDLPMLGIYSIGYTLAALPLMVGSALVSRLMIPLYRDHLPQIAVANLTVLRRYRFGLSAGLLTIAGLLILTAKPLIGFLYDERYQQAAGILVILSISFMPQLLSITYDQFALTVGDSRRFFILTAMRGIMLLLCLGIGASLFGLMGVIIGFGVSSLVSSALIARLARHYHIWDPLHDTIMGAIAITIAVAGLWINWQAILMTP